MRYRLYHTVMGQNKTNRYRKTIVLISAVKKSNPYSQNIDALISDTHTLFLSILILNSHCVGVAIKGIDTTFYYNFLLQRSILIKIKSIHFAEKTVKM